MGLEICPNMLYECRLGQPKTVLIFPANPWCTCPKSQSSNYNVPNNAPNDQSLNHNSNNNTIEGEISQPAPASVVQTHAAVELATINPSTSRRPKRTIRPRLHADQAEISDNDCANSDCDDPKRPGELLKCSGLGCRSKVCTPCRVG